MREDDLFALRYCCVRALGRCVVREVGVVFGDEEELHRIVLFK